MALIVPLGTNPKSPDCFRRRIVRVASRRPGETWCFGPAQHRGVSRWRPQMAEHQTNIPLRAYELWDAAGRPEGRSDEFYFRAEEEFRQLLESHVLDSDTVRG